LKYYLTREPLPFIHIFFFIDSDYGGTVVTDDSNLTEMPYEESVPERNCHVPPTIESDVTMDMSLPMDIPHSQLDQPTEVAESLENPTYTDSLSSNDSAAAFIYRDQNKIWAQTEVELDEDENADVKLLENPAYIDSVTSKIQHCLFTHSFQTPRAWTWTGELVDVCSTLPKRFRWSIYIYEFVYT
jgi:hypothetical protein